MQTDQKRMCPACSAENPEQAGFCWQCFAPFAPAAPAAPAPNAPSMPPVPGATPHAFAPTPQPSRSRLGAPVEIGAGLLVAIVVTTLVRNALIPTYHVPEAVAGQPRIHTSDAQSFEQQMVDEGKKYDITLEAAVYGQADRADVFLVLANGTAEESADELFDDFLGGVESAGITVDHAQTVTGQHDGAEYRCVPLSGRIQAAACIWREEHSVGLTLDASPEGNVTAAVFAAYDATHA